MTDVGIHDRNAVRCQSSITRLRHFLAEASSARFLK
jgi:hypothetical protein